MAWPVKLWVRLKVILKEGVLYGQWDQVFRLSGLYGNHYITNQLVCSFEKNGFQLLEKIEESEAPLDMVVFRDVRNLRKAIKAKASGRVKRLFAGPFLVTMPFEAAEIMLDPAIDGLIFLSKWHQDLFMKHAKRTPAPGHIWFAGIDTEEWSPLPTRSRDAILIFIKQVPDEQLLFVKKCLDERAEKYQTIRYGEYSREQYKILLNGAKFVIFLHQSETQGLATFEAWSMGCPTLHWNPGVMKFLGVQYSGASSCPYLEDALGMSFTTWDEFIPRLEEMRSSWQKLDPRTVVQTKYTAQKSLEKFFEIFRD